MTVNESMYFMMTIFFIAFANSGFKRDIAIICIFSILTSIVVSDITVTMGAQYYVFAFAIDIIFLIILMDIVSRHISHIYFLVWIPYLIALFMHLGVLGVDYIFGMGIVHPHYDGIMFKLNVLQILILLAGCDGIRNLFAYSRSRYNDILLSFRNYSRVQIDKEAN